MTFCNLSRFTYNLPKEKSKLKTFFLMLTMLVCSAAASAQVISPVNNDFTIAGHLAPGSGSAGQTDPCAPVFNEATWFSIPSTYYILAKLGPCSWGTDVYGTYTTTNTLHLQEVNCWMGTSANSRFEIVSNLQIWYQIGGIWHLMYDQLCEFDKHQDVKGNQDLMWNYSIPIDVPAGARINVYRYPGGAIFCGADYWRIEGPSVANGTPSNPSGNDASASSWNNCAVEIHWRLVGTGK